MKDEILAELIKTVEVQTSALNDVMEICTMLKDRIEILEQKVNR